MSRLVATLRLDITLQARSKLYAMGIGAAVLVGMVGRFLLDPSYAGRIMPAFYLLGVGSTTYVFVASLVLFEKSQGTLQALGASPLRSWDYINSKLITLTGFALIESLIVYALSFWGVPFSPVPLLTGLAALCVVNTLIGVGQIVAHDTVTSFLMPGALLVGTILQLPVFFVLDIGPALAWYLVPSQGPLLLMLAAFEPLQAWQWVYAVGMSISAIAVSAWWARRRFARFIAMKDH